MRLPDEGASSFPADRRAEGLAPTAAIQHTKELSMPTDTTGVPMAVLTEVAELRRRLAAQAAEIDRLQAEVAALEAACCPGQHQSWHRWHRRSTAVGPA
jgi:uncharacterized small protein (DUF1192 family)